jgi:hypothetical protein
MGTTFCLFGREEKSVQIFLWENLKEGNHFEELGVAG